ncbi:protein of unknown function [Taphrina deformans PYCC 5710]|uniref:DUF4110 domain-containing protein n=1 Tax=Taphrina deformans (strain PYCC 5710 / ATCC 11124 / CBS 356.35 / IMI 108563 / JCM 9778 / NBRC 8474) TaxID=1097556 RepID=R4XFD3_TAPDE|nr:protein of unknown function [Taphrina deformans PYCC 5710]|eukprot:CCG84486.1 protein of unknown function [Taphrina deformans PYCC 5710]
MVKKDKATAAAAKKQRALLKTAKKGNKKTKKSIALANADEEDQDIDTILAEYQAKQTARQVITEVACDPPTTRINSSLTPNPLKPELFLFGGEFFDGSVASFYNELYIYSVNKNTWTRNTSPNSPLPRSSHQTVVHKDQVWLFGGEFSSPKQNTFYHYGDFWSLDCMTRAWTKVEVKPSPSARSGHRMASVGKYILLFGGFQDTSQETKYLGDLWAFDTDNYEWIEIKPPTVGQKPESRSGCVFAPAGKDEAILFGGYVKKKISGKISRGVILDDYWTLKLIGEPKTWVWVKRKRPATLPSKRVGAAIALHRTRLILFGGVFDTKEGEESLESTFFNDLHCLSLEASRWFPLKVRPPRKAPKKPVVDRRRDRDERVDDLIANERLLQQKMGEEVPETEEREVDEVMEDATEEVGKIKLSEIELTMNMPHPRFNANMAVSGDALFVFGGVYEQGEKEYSLNDMHTIDLAKLDGVRQLFGSVIAPIEESESEEETDDESDEEEPEQKSVFYENIPDDPKEEEKAAEEVDPDAPADPRPMPKPFENIKAYFTRCATGWEKYLLPWNQAISPKELRTKAFVRAEDYWWQVREQIRIEEDNMEDSGIGEVIEAAEGVAVRDEKGVVGKRR